MPESTIQLWACPECGAIVKVSEALPPDVFDAEDMLEMSMLTFRYENMGKAMWRFRLAMLFCRFGCWLAGIDLEWDGEQLNGESTRLGSEWVDVQIVSPR